MPNNNLIKSMRNIETVILFHVIVILITPSFDDRKETKGVSGII